MKILKNQCSELQSIRKFLGFEIQDAAHVVGYSARSWQYWELEERIPPTKVLMMLDILVQFVLDMTDRKERYESLPYFVFYDDFKAVFGDNSEKYKWRLWQKIASMMRINKKCKALSNRGSVEKCADLSVAFNDFFIRFEKRNKIGRGKIDYNH